MIQKNKNTNKALKISLSYFLDLQTINTPAELVPTLKELWRGHDFYRRVDNHCWQIYSTYKYTLKDKFLLDIS